MNDGCIELLKGFAEFAAHCAEVGLFIGTIFLALYTCQLFKATRKLAIEAEKSSKQQLGVNVWIELSRRFNSPEMIKARSKFAETILNEVAPKYQESDAERVLPFFEDLGKLYIDDLIARELADNTFNHYVRRWWIAADDYIKYIRKNDPSGHTYYTEFQKYNEIIYVSKVDADTIDIKEFLTQEFRLVPLPPPPMPAG